MSILYEERLDGALPDVDRTSVLMALREHVPGLEILHTDEEIIPYECDGLSAYRTRPLLVVLPKQMEQVTAILAVCHRLRVPVVTRGAGTGLSGGALPLEKGVLLVMARFKEILDINPVGRRARVQPGVRNLAISQAVAPHNLYYAPDPSSQIACSIGGNVAENAGGVHCLKYGLTVHNLLKIEVQTLDGEALTLGSDALDSPGFDLLALFTGSEGMLGVTTEVTVKLLPKPPVARVLLASFDSVEKAGLAVGDIIANGIIPGGLEMMDNLSIRAAEDFIHAGYPVDAEAILLCELDGVESDVQEDCERVNDILLKAGATDVRLAQDEAERVRFWAGRKNAFPAVGRISPDYYCMDGTIPRRALPGVLEGIARLSQQYDLRVANVFHAGDGNMHPLILFDANEPGEFARAEELGGKILELCVEVGGSISGEHGIGREKITEQRQRLKSRLLQAMLYPLVLLVVATGVVTILLTAVVPKIIEQFDHLGHALPASTRTLIAMSDALQASGVYWLAGLLALLVLGQRLLKNPTMRLRWDKTVLRLPVTGRVARGLNTARFSRTLSILTASSVPLLEGIQTAAAVSANRYVEQQLLLAADRVREGSSLRAALAELRLFPPMMLYMIASGEQSGELETMLEQAAVNQEREFDTQVGLALGLFEPALVVMMAGVVLFIVIAILEPMLQLNNMVGM